MTSACLAKLGHTVVGLDLDKEVVQGLQRGKAPLFEPGLDELLADNIAQNRLSFTENIARALKSAEVVWVALDTPVNDKDIANITLVEKSIRKILPFLNSGTLVVISSQAPVGFVGRIEKIVREKYPEKKCLFACAPENLRLGSALDVFLNPDRIVIGVRDEKDRKAFSPLFSSITSKLEWMRTESAEMTKHAINSFLATSVCFANEIASLCEQVAADAREVERGMKSESRIGPRAYVGPGMAFSGGTLARDIHFLIKLSKTKKLPSYLLKSVDASNAFHKDWILRKCRRLVGVLKKKNVAILGLTYKPRTDTLRRSPAIELAQALRGEGATVRGYDPAVRRLPGHLAKVLHLKKNLTEAVGAADLVILATEWPEFKAFDQDALRLLRRKLVIDPRGFAMKQLGTDNAKYFCVGKGTGKRERERS